MDHLTATFLALVQGLTEFLPVSSSGHLVIAESAIGRLTGKAVADVVVFNIVLHVGTLGAVLLFYRRRIVRLFGADRQVLAMIAVGTLPAVVVGLPLHKFAASTLSNPMLTGCMLVATGCMLLGAGRLSKRNEDYVQLRYRDALLIGLFQAFALLPGISRSGTTITAGLLIGLRPEAACAFSFLLAIPAIGGAALLTLSDSPAPTLWLQSGGVMLIGAAVSFLVGYFALWWLVRWLERGRLWWFALWCLPVGLATIVWQSLP